jgi:hypothetical protein
MRIPRRPLTLTEIMQRVGSKRMAELLGMQVGQFVNGNYVHWEKLRFLEPPEGTTVDEWWAAIKFARWGGRKYFTELKPVSDHHSAISCPTLRLRSFTALTRKRRDTWRCRMR